jgi:hypothetical protein
MHKNIGLSLHFKRWSSRRTCASFQKTFVWKDIGFVSNKNEEMTRSVKLPKTLGLAFIRKDVTFILKDLHPKERKLCFKRPSSGRT